MDQKKERFVNEWVDTLDPHRASIALVGRKKARREETYKAIQKDKELRAKIKERNEFLNEIYQVQRHQLTRTLLAILNFDERELYDENGHLRHPKDWTFEQQLAVKDFKETQTIRLSGEIERRFEIGKYDLTKCVKLLYDINKTFIDNLDDETEDREKEVSQEVMEKIEEIRKRRRENLSSLKVEMDFDNNEGC